MILGKRIFKNTTPQSGIFKNLCYNDLVKPDTNKTWLKITGWYSLKIGGNMTNKTCSFFGHRKAVLQESELFTLKKVIEELINDGYSRFLYGSRSDFDSLCHDIVNDFKQIYTHIKEIAYVCLSESVILESEKKEWERRYSRLNKQEVKLKCFDEMVSHKTKYTAGRASYVERNKEMIDQSDCCIFYYDPDYQLPARSHKIFGMEERPNSGTRIAYEYATRKKKKILNIKNNAL